MAEFLEERIKIGIRSDATYQDGYNVEITTTKNGNEYRKLTHPFPVRTFKISYIGLTDTLYTDVVNLYHRAYGKFAGFRAKCLDDFTTKNLTDTPTFMDQTLIVLTTKTFQLVKRYGIDKAGLTIGWPVRYIFKPVAGTVIISVGGTQVTSGWTVSTVTGIVTFVDVPGGTVCGGCEFDIPVRFNSDVVVNMSDKYVHELNDIELIELLQP